MHKSTPWDFRDSRELEVSEQYEEHGYIVEDAEFEYIESMRKEVETLLQSFTNEPKSDSFCLETAHCYINSDRSNDLRLYIAQNLSLTNEFSKNYYFAAKNLLDTLCGNELVMQKRPGISINFPNNKTDVLPIHADTWNGVSPYELNIWIPFVDCRNSMCLYILKRKEYLRRLEDSKGLLELTSDELYNELKDDLTWIPVKYGQIMAFDQSLPHGYCLNKETTSHWSMNCRFKGLHTPYWDKKLGEYFMPILVRSSTRTGMNYRHPENWI